MINFICYERCSTCKKAEKFLIDHNIKFKKRDIKTDNPTLKELKTWYKKSNLPLKKFFNTSGLKYKELNLKDKLVNMSKEEALRLLASDGLLVKRPILLINDEILIGFKEEEYKNILK